MSAAVVLMAYGSPDRLEDVPAYYADIRGGRPIKPEHLEDLVARYRRLGIEDSNPLNEITEATRAALEAELGIPVFTGMRHWQPRIADAVERRSRAARTRSSASCSRRTTRRCRSAATARSSSTRSPDVPSSASSSAGATSRASSSCSRSGSRRTARARRLHRPLAAGADPRRGRPVPGRAARVLAARRRARGRATSGRSPSRASRRPASPGSGRTSSST